MQLLRLRYFQLKRDLGYWVAFIAAAAFYISYEIAGSTHPHALSFLCLVAILFYNYHLNRQDLHFISKYLEHPKIQVFLNYNIIVLPLSAGFLVSSHWYLAPAFHVLVSLVSIANFKVSSFRLLFIRNFIPPEHFEWVAGLRKNFHILCLIFVIALLLSPVKLFGPVALLVFNSILMGFYNFYEPLLMLNPSRLAPPMFLNKKTSYFSKTFLVVNFPLLALNSIFNPEVLWFNLGFLFAILILANCAVYIKYANYKPNDSIRFSIDYLVLVASVLFPYLIPLSIFIYFSNRKKALLNLSNYSHDTN